MNFPEELFYTEEHEWIKIEDGYAYVGITDFAQNELGDIVYLDVDCLDLHLRRDDVFGTVEAVKTVSDLFLPVSGKVVEINSYVVNNASYLNDDPYENWIIKIEISDMDDISSLLKRDEYTSLIGV